MKTLLVVSSYHHRNTLKVAHAMAEALRAEVAAPEQVTADTLAQYDLIGFGSGIYSSAHHPKLLTLAESLPATHGKKAFLFSTDGTPRFVVKDEEWLRRKMDTDHAALRMRLIAKGYAIAGEFNCAGYNTNSFLKLFGGLNKGRPNAEDLQRAAAFAKELAAN